MVTRAASLVLRVAAVASTLALVVGVSSAGAAFVIGPQVNDDPAAGIDPNRPLSSENPNSDAVGGALTAGGVNVPWSIFRQTTTGKDQIFVRSFSGGVETTRGVGTVGGRSSASPFPASLNFDQGEDGEAPEIDFAGAGRTVPWATWYEDTTGVGFNAENIFASRFDPASGNWIFAGQGRGNGGTGPQVPSLNIHTDQDAENPSVAGGSAVDATKPGPWVTWQETANNTGKDQIFVERPIGPNAPNCTGVTPAGGDPISGFCFQQTGIPRAGTGNADPSLNVDPTRDGVEPDIAFTGVQDGVPWVVWYEKNPTGTLAPKLHDNELVFAAKGLASATPAGNGGFNWTVVGNQASGLLDTSGTHGFGNCGTDPAVEGQCSLNANPDADAEDPRVAAGTMNPANATAPWVVWVESVGGTDRIFVSRLVGGANFVLANGGQPISSGSSPASNPDITFSGNTPYVTWREQVSAGDARVFAGHFVDAANPTFVLDTPGGGPVEPTADVRFPISSGCTANPFNGDGKNCQGGAIGTPFFGVVDPLRLFGVAYQATGVTTGGASAIGQTTATVSGSVNPEGAAVKAHFDFGTTTNYGSSTPDQRVGVTNTPQSFSEALSGLPAGATIHYRVVVTSDFTTQFGADQTLTTASAGGGGGGGGGAAGGGTTTTPVVVPPRDTTAPTVTLRLRKITLTRLLKTRKLSLRVTSDEASTDEIAATVPGRRTRKRKRPKPVTIGATRVTFSAAGTQTVTMSLTRRGRAALRHRRSVRITFTIKATDLAGNSRTSKTTASVGR
jgi:hypothetical protein